MSEGGDGPLTGIRVLDFTRFVAGPLSTLLLSDWGAEVIKVESPETGDLSRRVSLQPDGYSSFFESLNRGKRSITVNLKDERGLEIVERLTRRSDVLVENYTTGTMERLGLSYERARELNPRIIYASGSGYGPRGPNSGSPMFAQVANGVAGLMDQVAPLVGEPVVLGGSADPSGGTYLALGIAVALFERERSGKGQHVDASLIGSLLSLSRSSLTETLRTGRVRYPTRRSHSTSGQFLCRDDRWLVIAANDNRMFVDLCAVLGRKDLLEDPRFRNGRARESHSEVLEPILETEFLRRDRDVWLHDLRAASVPSGPVNSYADLVHDPDVLANEYILRVHDPRWGEVSVVGSPIHFSRTPAQVASSAPELGRDTAEVLVEVGYSDQEIAGLQSARVV